MKIRDIFTITALVFALGLVLKLLESVFSKDDGILYNDTKDILSNNDDKQKILAAITNSRSNKGEVQNVKLSSDKTIEVSTSL